MFSVHFSVHFRNVQVVSEDSDVCNIKFLKLSGLPNGTTRGVQLHRTQGNHLSACSSQCHACHVQVIIDISRHHQDHHCHNRTIVPLMCSLFLFKWISKSKQIVHFHYIRIDENSNNNVTSYKCKS